MTPETWPLKSYLPASAIAYCFRLWEKYLFEVRVSAPRKTKLGDYRFRPDIDKHFITINCDLNPYGFLVVYLHEVAHCVSNIRYGMKIKPHGPQWQQEMKSLVAPLMSLDIFPQDILEALRSYLKAPKAASCSHPQLTRALRKQDPPTDKVPLEQLPVNCEFMLNSRKYRLIKRNRTRVKCLETGTNRTWLIPKLALVAHLRYS